MIKLKIIVSLVIIFLFSLALISCGTKDTYSENILITSVHDGDTFTTRKNQKIRLFGVDTAEVSDQFNDFKETEGIEGTYGMEATLEARELISGKVVDLCVKAHDPYGRLVASVKINGIDLASDLVKKGLARVAYISSDPKNPYYSTEFDYYISLLRLQHKAFEEKLGFWRQLDRFREIFPKAN